MKTTVSVLERTKLFPSPIDDRKKIVAIRGYFTRLNRVDNNAIFAVAQISFSFEGLLLDSRGTKRDFR